MRTFLISDFLLIQNLESMELKFKKKLDERQEYVESLLKEMKEKEQEFQEYCRQVEIDRKL